MSEYTPPKHPLEVLQKIDYDEAVREDDPRYVDLDEARGGESLSTRLAPKFQLDLQSGLFFPTRHRHVLLFGPIGSGKSTELLRFSSTLRKSGKIFPLLLNVRGEIDINNLQYADMLMALTSALTKELETRQIELPQEALLPLKKWFTHEVRSEDTVKEISGDITSQATLEGGIPLIAKLMSRITATFKSSSINKESMREVVKKTFTLFAEAFNSLTKAAEKALNERGLGERLLFIIDGTDKIPLSDAERLFIVDTEQLLTIEAYVLYTAPIVLKYVGASHGKLDSSEVLPIVKLYHKDGSRHEPGWHALCQLVSRRIDPVAFQDQTLSKEALIQMLIEASGGHPRELLRLLRLACELTRSSTIDATVIDTAVNRLAADYRYWLKPEDYDLLARIDAAGGGVVGNDEHTRNLLYRLALLQYNDGSWRRSNPVVRRLEGYTEAIARLRTGASQPENG